MSDADQYALAERLLATCRARGLTVVTAESCTGGLVAAALTAIPGSSAVIDRGFVVYSDSAKTELLGVPERTLSAHGAVSAQTAAAMVRGALERSQAALAIAVTGIAGPAGGSAEKPVGLVYLACARPSRQPRVERHVFSGDRSAVRAASVHRALELLELAAVEP